MPRQKTQISNLLLHDNAERNPFGASPDEGTLTNMAPHHGMLKRVPFMPPFHSSASSSRVWHIVDFQFQRDSARNQQILIFKSDGKIYRRMAGTELEIFPAASGYAALVQKPSVVNLADRLHVNDGSQYLIYDGWGWVTAGLTAPAAPSCSLVASGSLTGSYDISVTAVHIRNGVRIHESSRSSVTSNSPSAQNIRVTQPTLDSRATHWSVYMSELSSSAVYRRVATVAITSTTTDISAEPAGTSPTAPIRNDPPKKSRVLSVWKNRIAMRDEQAKSNLWFTAFGEVAGLNNGAPEECLPGASSSSISDLVNEWTLPDSGEPIKACVWHNEYLWAFSDRNGYMIQGEGTLLDNTGTRDFFPVHLFTFGAANPWCAASLPQGLVVLTPDKKLNFWAGSGTEIQNIGDPIQQLLNDLTDTQLSEIELTYWEGGGNTWLLLPLSDRVAIFDFSVRTQDDPIGVWYNVQTGTNPTSMGGVSFSGLNVMLLGQQDGSVVQFDNSSQISFTVNQPAHLGLSMVLGNTYLGSTVQSSPNSVARTAAIPTNAGAWTEGHYVEIFHRGTGDAASITPVAPTLKAYYDEIDPNNPQTAVTQTLSSVSGSKEKRAWLAQSASSSGVGAVAKRFQFEIDFTTTTTDGQARPQCVNDEVLSFGFSYTPLTDLRL